MKTLALLITSLILSGCATTQYSNVEKRTEDVWVAITYDTYNSADYVYTKIEKETFNKITSGRVNEGWLELRNCYWEDEGQIVPVIVAGQQWGYSGDQVIRIEDISRIAVISAHAVNSIEKLGKLNQAGDVNSE